MKLHQITSAAVCVCVCVRACVRACVRVCVCVCARARVVCVTEQTVQCQTNQNNVPHFMQVRETDQLGTLFVFEIGLLFFSFFQYMLRYIIIIKENLI